MVLSERRRLNNNVGIFPTPQVVLCYSQFQVPLPSPRQHQALACGSDTALKHFRCLNLDHYFLFPILGVEMRRPMIIGK